MTIAPSQPPSTTEGAVVTYRGEALAPRVAVGDLVETGTTLAEETRTPAASILQVAEELRRSAKSVVADLSARIDSMVSEGEELAVARGPLGIGRRSVTAPVSGRLISIMADVGALVIQPESTVHPLTATFPGRVEAVGSNFISMAVSGHVLRSIAGTGQIVQGALRIIDRTGSVADAFRTGDTDSAMGARVFALQSPIDAASLNPANAIFWRPDPIALIVPSMSHRDLATLRLSHPAVSVVVMRGFGSIPFGDSNTDDMWRTLCDAAEQEVAFFPAERDRAPLVVLPGTGNSATSSAPRTVTTGDTVTVIGGITLRSATVVEVPEHDCVLPAGTVAAVVRVIFDDGTVELVPRDAVIVTHVGQTQD
jgi:hypothetical protein